MIDILSVLKLEDSILEFLNSMTEGLKGSQGIDIFNQMYKIIDKDIMIDNL